MKRKRPGTVLVDKEGHYWMVRDDGETAAGTNGGVMVDLSRGTPIFTPSDGIEGEEASSP